MLSFLDLLACKSLQAFSAFLRALPLEMSLGFGRFVGNIAFYFYSRRRVAYADMKAALGAQYSEKERWSLVRRNFAHWGQMMVEVLRFPKLDKDTIEQTMKVHYLDGYFDVFKEKKGGIFLTAHFGNWEMMQVLPPRIFNEPLHVLARGQKFPKLNAFLNSLRESLGTVVTTRGMEIRNLLHSLRRGEWVGLLGDQDAGKTSGMILPLLGRKTTVPTGPFEFAGRTGTSVIPVFVARQQGPYHEIYVGKPVKCRPDSQEDIEAGARYYISLLERFVKKYPEQWLWETKRWKYSWTKRLLILSDGKPGHVKQSQSIAEQISAIKTQYGRPGMEYPQQVLPVAFKSGFHRAIFPWFCAFFIPFAQGRLRFLSFFFESETAKDIEEASADFIISAGSSLVPLNLCIAKDCRAKSLVLMRPSFPFNLYKYDLSVVPAHDLGGVPQEAFRMLLTPSTVEPEAMERDAAILKKQLRDPSRVRYSVFLGGDTRRFKMKHEDIRTIFETLERLSADGDYLVTTSRRTSDAVVRYLEKEIRPARSCQLLVDAKRDTRREVVGGMMFWAEILIVTEDSISMISEALRSGKRVIVLCFDGKGLPSKHRRFREILARESAIVTASPQDLEEKIKNLKNQPAVSVLQTEAEALKKRLQAIL